MDSCRHQKLILIKKENNKLRCAHCHLTINRDELESDFCPECWETEGIRRRDFEKVEEKNTDIDTYRCEQCGIAVEAGNK